MSIPIFAERLSRTDSILEMVVINSNNIEGFSEYRTSTAGKRSQVRGMARLQ